MFNLRINIGVCLDSEIPTTDSDYLLTKMQNIDEYSHFYMHTHNYHSKKQGYNEMKINPDECPDGMPHTWFRIARQKRNMRTFSQYEDPFLQKRIVKKYVTGGIMKYFVVITHGKRKIKEIEFGAKPPTNN